MILDIGTLLVSRWKASPRQCVIWFICPHLEFFPSTYTHTFRQCAVFSQFVPSRWKWSISLLQLGRQISEPHMHTRVAPSPPRWTCAIIHAQRINQNSLPASTGNSEHWGCNIKHTHTDTHMHLPTGWLASVPCAFTRLCVCVCIYMYIPNVNLQHTLLTVYICIVV